MPTKLETSLLFSKIVELEEEKKELEKQVSEEKAKCEAIERQETERREIEEKKHTEEVQFLKRTNQQLKVSKNPRIPNTSGKILIKTIKALVTQRTI